MCWITRKGQLHLHQGSITGEIRMTEKYVQCQDKNAKNTNKFRSFVSLRIPKLSSHSFKSFPERFYNALLPQIQRKILTPWIAFGHRQHQLRPLPKQQTHMGQCNDLCLCSTPTKPGLVLVLLKEESGSERRLQPSVGALFSNRFQIHCHQAPQSAASDASPSSLSLFPLQEQLNPLSQGQQISNLFLLLCVASWCPRDCREGSYIFALYPSYVCLWNQCQQQEQKLRF